MNPTKILAHPGMYFHHVGDVFYDKNEWNIITYINLTTYHQELWTIKQ